MTIKQAMDYRTTINSAIYFIEDVKGMGEVGNHIKNSLLVRLREIRDMFDDAYLGSIEQTEAKI